MNAALTLRELARLLERIAQREDKPLLEGAALINAKYVLKKWAYEDEQQLLSEFDKVPLHRVMN
jgi:hypothetical protein